MSTIHIRTIEEGAAALASVLDEKTLAKAASGDFGREISLLTIGEKARREQLRKKRAPRSAA